MVEKKNTNNSDVAQAGMKLASNPNAGLGPTKPNTNDPKRNKNS